LINNVVRDIFRVNLGVKKHERVLIFHDRISKKEDVDKTDKERRSKLAYLSLLAAEIGKNLCKSITRYEYPATGSHGSEPPAQLWEFAFGKKAIERLRESGILSPLLKKTVKERDLKVAEDIIRTYKNHAVQCVIALANYSTSHTRFRDFLTRICGCRYASMPLFDISMLEGSMNVDWKALAKRTMRIAQAVKKAPLIEVKTPNGTYISFLKKRRKTMTDTGILTRKGSFSNLPAGEVYFAPLEGTSHGKLVLEWGQTNQLESPVTLTVKDGYVVGISGNDPYAEQLSTQLSVRKENANIAELGIGTNEAAKRPDNILESEKILGTIHIALGDNSSFGGSVKTPFHQDFVFFQPTVTLIFEDGRRGDILMDGKVII
jgi:leucyl aminopeptidase (aminopeptidase T)